MEQIANSHNAPWLTNSGNRKRFRLTLEMCEVYVLPLRGRFAVEW